jgi:hypothetical protein
LKTVVVELQRRHPSARQIDCGHLVVHDDDVVWIRNGKFPQQHTINNSEGCGRYGNTQGKRKQRNQCKARLTKHHPVAVTNVLE